MPPPPPSYSPPLASLLEDQHHRTFDTCMSACKPNKSFAESHENRQQFKPCSDLEVHGMSSLTHALYTDLMQCEQHSPFLCK